MILSSINFTHSFLIVLIVSVITILLRFIPFIIFNNKETTKIITYLSNVLPFAIMGMLVVYCLKDINIKNSPFGIPELIASTIVVLVHLWKRNTLFSILSGTIIYMILIQFVFI